MRAELAKRSRPTVEIGPFAKERDANLILGLGYESDDRW